MTTRVLLSLAAAAALSLSACGGDAPAPVATPQPTPEATPEPTPEATPEPTPEPTPASTEFSDAFKAFMETVKDADRARTNPKSGDAEAIKVGGEEFQSTCFPCHGRTGEGDGPAARAMGITPADLSSAGFAERVPAGVQFKVMKNGVKGTSMQAFGAALSDDQIWQILAFVETLAQPAGE